MVVNILVHIEGCEDVEHFVRATLLVLSMCLKTLQGLNQCHWSLPIG